jgi:hypothetical protein
LSVALPTVGLTGGRPVTSKEVLVLIDCDACTARGPGCSDCVVSVLLGAPPAAEGALELDGAERAALAVLAGSGLVPPLRMVRDGPDDRRAG